MIRLAGLAAALRGRRGTVAVMTALMTPALLGAAGLAIDLGVWYRQAGRLQIAADAGAMGAARLLSAQTAGNSAYQAAALIEVNGVSGGTWLGTLQTPVAVSVATDFSTVTVTVTSTPTAYFTRAIGFSPGAMSATAKAGFPVTTPNACVLALSTSASPAIQVDNNGTIISTGCPIFSNSTSTSKSIYLNSGKLEGSSIGAAGLVLQSNSGGNTMDTLATVNGSTVATPTTGNSYATSQTDPFSGLTLPSPGSSCNAQNNYTSYGTYTFNPTTFCGNVTIGGNGSTDTFNAGTYYIVNGNLTFTNAAVNSSSGVTFVLTGTNPGTFSWTNNSNGTITAATSGSLSGVLLWQTPPCSSSACSSFSSCATSCSSATSCTATNYFGGPQGGGGALQATGAIYTPCSGLDFTNNTALKTATGGSLSVVAQTLYAAGSASSLSTAASSSASSSASQITLLQ
jgi:Flp pilus assembly protein TadG